MKSITINIPCAMCAAAAMVLAPITAEAAGNPSFNVRHMASEQNIISVKNTSNYLLLPVQDNAPEARVITVTADNEPVGVAANVRLAREKVDYYVPLDLSDYRGDDVTVQVLGLPAGACTWDKMKLSETFDTANREKFRPVYHHTPEYGWMNDPNGMFYKDGVYHLYFQYNPYGSTWGNLSWGHSISTDLVHWTYEGAPVMPDAYGMIFSGSAVVDHYNTAGFGEGAIVAFYTSAKPSPWGDSQSQSMAYSTDGGKTFTKYTGNPVLVSDKRDFRDPKVFWYAPGKHWVMILAAGQEMEIYSSRNLKEWKKESSFGAKQGAHGGEWECPDLFELPVESTDETRWVLICNINPGGPFGGNAAQYFVGTFNGKKFVNESPTETKWMDWGKDHYATVTFNNAPDGRVIALGWMSNWQYQTVPPTKQYRGANTIARDLTLFRDEDGEWLMRCAPSTALRTARVATRNIPAFQGKESYEIPSLLDDNDGAYEIELQLKNSGASRITLTLSNDKGEKVHMHYAAARRQFVMERSESGLTDFSADFPAMTVAPVEDTDNIRLSLYVDRSSIEAFGDGGKFVMTNRVFPSAPYNKMKFETWRGHFQVKSMKVYKLK